VCLVRLYWIVAKHFFVPLWIDFYLTVVPITKNLCFHTNFKIFLFPSTFFSPLVKLFKNLFIFWIIKLPLDTIKGDRFTKTLLDDSVETQSQTLKRETKLFATLKRSLEKYIIIMAILVNCYLSKTLPNQTNLAFPTLTLTGVSLS